MFMGITTEEIRRLAVGTTGERRRAANLRGCPPDVLQALTADRDRWVAYAAWENRSLPESFLESFILRAALSPRVTARASHPAMPVSDTGAALWAALENPSATSRALNEVAERSHRSPADPVFSAILSHPNCPRKWMDWAMTNPGTSHLDVINHVNVLLRSRLARNPALPGDLAERLLRDPEQAVRRRAIHNKAVPVALLEAMPAETNPVALRALSKRLTGPALQACIEALVNRRGGDGVLTALLVARHSTDPARVTAASWDSRPRVRKAVATNVIASDTDLVAVALQA